MSYGESPVRRSCNLKIPTFHLEPPNFTHRKFNPLRTYRMSTKAKNNWHSLKQGLTKLQ